MRSKSKHDVEALGSSIPSILLEYVPPRKRNTKPMHLTKDSKYLLETLAILEGDKLGKVPNLRYEDNNLNERAKFLEYVAEKYIQKVLNV